MHISNLVFACSMSGRCHFYEPVGSIHNYCHLWVPPSPHVRSLTRSLTSSSSRCIMGVLPASIAAGCNVNHLLDVMLATATSIMQANQSKLIYLRRSGAYTLGPIDAPQVLVGEHVHICHQVLRTVYTCASSQIPVLGPPDVCAPRTTGRLSDLI